MFMKKFNLCQFPETCFQSTHHALTYIPNFSTLFRPASNTASLLGSVGVQSSLKIYVFRVLGNFKVSLFVCCGGQQGSQLQATVPRITHRH